MKLWRYLFCSIGIIVLRLITYTNSRYYMIDDKTFPNISEWQWSVIPEIYDKTEPPEVDGKIPVHFAAFQANIESFDLNQMGILGIFTVNLSWVDCRLNFPADSADELLDVDVSSKLWIPHLRCRNCRNYKPATFSLEVADMYYYNGNVTLSLKVLEFFMCDLNLWRYPMDFHWCHMELEFYQFEDLLEMKIEPAVSIIGKDRALQIHVAEANASPCKASMLGYENERPCFSANILVERNMGYQLINIVVPSFAIVMISWGTFYVHPTDAPSRVTIGLMTILALCNRFAGVSGKIPITLQVKAIDVWMNVTLSFVFFSLLIYVKALVNYQRANKVKVINVKPTTPEATVQRRICGCFPLTRKKTKSVEWTIDKKARYIFPPIFLIFNIVYWYIYLTR